MTFLSPNLGHISFLQGVVIAQKYREFITTEFFSPKKPDSLNFKSIKKFNGTLRLPTNGTLNPKLRGVFFWGSVSETWMKGRLDTGVSPVVLWGDTWLARLVTQLVPSTVGFAPSVDWVEAVLWLSPEGARTGQQQNQGVSWGKDGKMKSVKSLNIFNEWFFLLEPSFFLWECWRATPCKGKETVLLFGSRFIIVWGYQSNQRMRMSRGHHGIYTFTSSRPDVLITTQDFFCQKKTAPLLKKKDYTKMMSPVPFSTRWLLEGFYTNGLLVRRAFRRSTPDRQVHGRKRLLLFSPKYTEHVVPAEKPHCASEG